MWFYGFDIQKSQTKADKVSKECHDACKGIVNSML